MRFEMLDSGDFDDEAPTNPELRALRPRVLVVEDDATLRGLIAARMRREAFEVIEAGSGHEALDLLALSMGDDLDLVVMDVRIPGTSGLDIARMLRANDWELPVVLMTAFPDAEIVAEAARLELALLAKPFLLDQLSDAAIAALTARAA